MSPVRRAPAIATGQKTFALMEEDMSERKVGMDQFRMPTAPAAVRASRARSDELAAKWSRLSAKQFAGVREVVGRIYPMVLSKERFTQREWLAVEEKVRALHRAKALRRRRK